MKIGWIKGFWSVWLLLLIKGSLLAQSGPFGPAADSVGGMGIHRDSNIIVGWTTQCTVVRGPQDITLPNGPLADVGDAVNVYGKANGATVSLGDGGEAIITLNSTLSNKTGFDFAVFENGFYDFGNAGYFLELAFVEVSSNGIDFFRFPNYSVTSTNMQTGTFGITDPTNITGYAGKYSAAYGVPFDLSDLDTVAGLDIMAITHIKIKDVIGTIDPDFASYDSDSNMINDPYPTNFGPGGFDLDAVALLDSSVSTNVPMLSSKQVHIFPNPFGTTLTISHLPTKSVQLMITNMLGNVVYSGVSEGSDLQLSTASWASGVYVVQIISPQQAFNFTVVK